MVIRYWLLEAISKIVDYAHYSPVERDPTTKLLGLDNENENEDEDDDDDEYDSGITLSNLVLVLLLVLDFGIFEVASNNKQLQSCGFHVSISFFISAGMAFITSPAR